MRERKEYKENYNGQIIINHYTSNEANEEKRIYIIWKREQQKCNIVAEPCSYLANHSLGYTNASFLFVSM
jgi:hypothetical protein